MEHKIHAIKNWEAAFDRWAGQFVRRHPYLGFLGMFVGIPVFTLLAVCVGTVIVALPVLWLLGQL